MKIFLRGLVELISYHLIKKLLKKKKEVVKTDNTNNYYDVKLNYLRLKNLKEFKKIKIFKINLTDVKKKLSNLKKLKKLINYKFKTSIKNGIAKFCDWYKKFLKYHYNYI